MVGQSGAPLGTITFENDGPHTRRVTAAERDALGDAIAREVGRLARWADQHRWPYALPQLDVIVADRFRISKSLVPAWNSHAGRMELPTRRVAEGKAAIMHELVHIAFPNANRLLAEGLAIHLQAEIGSNPAFPNFGRPLHVVAHEVLRELVPEFAPGEHERLDVVHLTEIDAIATPEPLTLRIGALVLGEEPRGQGCIYPLAGSFIRFLIEAHGLEQFRALYALTPLVPLAQNAGSPDRWRSVYRCALAELEREWKAMIVSIAPADQCDVCAATAMS